MEFSVVLCEGYHDRSFWSGWLEQVSVTRPDPPRPFEAAVKATGYDPGKGEFALRNPGGNFVGLRPVLGVDKILPNLRSVLRSRGQQWIDRIVVNIDPDTQEGDQRTGLRAEDILREARKLAPDAALTDGDAITLGGERTTTIYLVRWEVPGPTPAGVPEKQTLERLVCAAIQAVYPERADAVAAWLETLPDKPVPSPKAFSWSHMAGWFPDSGCDDFYRAIWRDDALAAELQRRLTASGAWRIAEALAV